MLVKLYTTILAEYRAWQGETRSSHLLLGVAQLAHASDASTDPHGSVDGSETRREGASVDSEFEYSE
jgi:hypothetical protein